MGMKSTLKLLCLLFVIEGLAFGKSNLNLSIQNQQQFRSKQELLLPFNNDVTFGKQNAKVEVVVFDSYSCIHCGRFYKEIFPILEKNYINKGLMFFIHKEFPLDKWALFATKVVACSQNKKTQMEAIYENQELLLQNNKYEKALLAMNGVDTKCVESFDDSTITKQVFEYSKVFGINGTPTVFVNGNKVERMTQKRLLKVIDEELSR